MRAGYLLIIAAMCFLILSSADSAEAPKAPSDKPVVEVYLPENLKPPGVSVGEGVSGNASNASGAIGRVEEVVKKATGKLEILKEKLKSGFEKIRVDIMDWLGKESEKVPIFPEPVTLNESIWKKNITIVTDPVSINESVVIIAEPGINRTVTGNATKPSGPAEPSIKNATEPGVNVTVPETIINETLAVPEPIVLNESVLREKLGELKNLTIKAVLNITSATRASWNPEGLENAVNITKSLVNMTREKAALIGLERKEISLKKLELRVKNDIERSISVTISRVPEEPPEDVGNITGIVYQYIEIEHRDLSNEEIENVTMVFDVNMTWVTGNGIDKNDIRLARYTGEWDRLPTEFLNETGDMYYYSATAPGLSMFAIFTERISVSMGVECVPLDLMCDNGIVHECSLEGKWQLKEVCPYECRDGVCLGKDEKPPASGGRIVMDFWQSINFVLVFVIVIVIIALIGGYLKFRSRSMLVGLPEHP